jgi:hypothetical protein
MKKMPLEEQKATNRRIRRSKEEKFSSIFPGFSFCFNQNVVYVLSSSHKIKRKKCFAFGPKVFWDFRQENLFFPRSLTVFSVCFRRVQIYIFLILQVYLFIVFSLDVKKLFFSSFFQKFSSIFLRRFHSFVDH